MEGLRKRGGALKGRRLRVIIVDNSNVRSAVMKLLFQNFIAEMWCLRYIESAISRECGDAIFISELYGGDMVVKIH